MGDATAIFSIHDQKDIEIHEVVQQVYDALKEKGYVPIQSWQQPYALETAFRRGTIFPDLDLPFMMGGAC